jgi:hypothetical protein
MTVAYENLSGLSHTDMPDRMIIDEPSVALFMSRSAWYVKLKPEALVF